jgi:hypothetical protein
MKISLGQKSKAGHLGIKNLITGESRNNQRYPFIIGASNNSDWRLGESSSPWSSGMVSITKEKQDVIITPTAPSSDNNSGIHSLLLNGEPFLEAIALPQDLPITLKIDSHLFALCLGQHPQRWADEIDIGQWNVFNGKNNQVIGTVGIDQIGELIAMSGQNFNECAIAVQGLNATALWVAALPDIIGVPVYETEEPETSHHQQDPITPIEAESEPELIPTAQGEYHCPICWQHFDGRHILNIASHPSLRGDELLGASEMRRFSPNQFDDEGNALDDFDIIAPDIACPHCHHRLPLGFVEMPQNIFSIVGAPSSGKSYYLSILIQELKRSLFERFDLTFSDQDPEYNIELNASINRLFSASTPEQGRIVKTQLTGGVYRRVKRDGQDVDLPKPYIYNASGNDIEGGEKCIIFYDNAGEHFLPQNSTSEDFHILHVARAKAIFFIFDPISNIQFKRSLKGVESAQLNLEQYEPDNQDVILAQMNVKIKKALGHPFASKLDFPLSIIVGKSDVWQHIMEDWDEISNPMIDGRLDQAILERNSKLTRNFLAKLCPAVVAGAEKLSSNVRFFPVSAFGHKPATYIDSNTGVEMIAPDPQSINPQMLEIPTVWALSQIAPELIPSV